MQIRIRLVSYFWYLTSVENYLTNNIRVLKSWIKLGALLLFCTLNHIKEPRVRGVISVSESFVRSSVPSILNELCELLSSTIKTAFTVFA